MIDCDAVVFDAVGTLIFPQPSVAEAYHQAAARLGIAVDQAEIRQRFRQAFARQEALDAQRPSPWQTSEAHETARWQAIVGEVFPECASPPQAEQLFADLWQHFALPQHWRIAADAVDVIAQLTSRGIAVAIGSNFDHRLHTICAGLPPLDTARVFVSSELGVRKPSLQFYQQVSHALQVAPERIVMVGDHWRNDIEGAQAARWQAILLTADVVALTREQRNCCRVIESLSQLLTL